jgi:hypothetical protein
MPRFVRSELVLLDTEVPAVAPPQSFVFGHVHVAKSEVLAITGWGQRLVLRRPGLVPAGMGHMPVWMTGTGLQVLWYLVSFTGKAEASAIPTTLAGKLQAAQGLIPYNGSDRILSPYDRSRRWSIVVGGEATVVLGARVVATSGAPLNLQDAIEELGGFLEGWRYDEASERIPDWAHFLALQTAR